MAGSIDPRQGQTRAIHRCLETALVSRTLVRGSQRAQGVPQRPPSPDRTYGRNRASHRARGLRLCTTGAVRIWMAVPMHDHDEMERSCARPEFELTSLVVTCARIASRSSRSKRDAARRRAPVRARDVQEDGAAGAGHHRVVVVADDDDQVVERHLQPHLLVPRGMRQAGPACCSRATRDRRTSRRRVRCGARAGGSRCGRRGRRDRAGGGTGSGRSACRRRLRACQRASPARPSAQSKLRSPRRATPRVAPIAAVTIRSIRRRSADAEEHASCLENRDAPHASLIRVGGLKMTLTSPMALHTASARRPRRDGNQHCSPSSHRGTSREGKVRQQSRRPPAATRPPRPPSARRHRSGRR